MKLPEQIKVVLQSLRIILLSLMVTFFAFVGCVGFIMNEPLVSEEFGLTISIPSYVGGAFILGFAIFLELGAAALTQEMIQTHSSKKHSRISKGIFTTLVVLPALLLTLFQFQLAPAVRAPAVGAGVILAVVGVLIALFVLPRAR